MERDTELRENSEVRVGGIVEDSHGQEAARGGDQSRGSAVGAFRVTNELSLENTIRTGNIHSRIGVDIDIVTI